MPPHIIPTNEYMPYEEVLFLIKNAKCILDLHDKDKDYTSSFLDLAYSMGKPIVTNNWFGLNKDNCIFCISNDALGEDILPDPLQLNKNISKALEMKDRSTDMSNYNEKLEKVIKSLFL